MNESELKVFIVILNWNGYVNTVACLCSLKDLQYSNFKIVVVDNGSTDGSEDKLHKKFSDITILQTNENLGYAAGNNIGIQYSLDHGADFVLLLNNDTIVDSNFLSPLVQYLESNKEVAAVCPKIYLYDDRRRIWFVDGPVSLWRGLAPHPNMGKVDNGEFSTEHSTDRIVGTAALMSREALERVGLLNEKYFLYWEEAEWSMRAKRFGFDLVVIPESYIWHNESSASGGRYSPTFLYYHTRNRLRFVITYGSWAQFITSLIYGWQVDLRLFFHLARRKKLASRQVRAVGLGYLDFFCNRSGKSGQVL